MSVTHSKNSTTRLRMGNKLKGGNYYRKPATVKTAYFFKVALSLLKENFYRFKHTGLNPCNQIACFTS